MKRRLPRAAKIGLRLCFAAVVLGLLFREVPFSSVADSLGRADCRYLAPAFLRVCWRRDGGDRCYARRAEKIEL